MSWGLITRHFFCSYLSFPLWKATFTRSPFRFSSRCPASQTLHGSDTKQELFTETTAVCVYIRVRVCVFAFVPHLLVEDLLWSPPKGKRNLVGIHQRARPQGIVKALNACRRSYECAKQCSAHLAEICLDGAGAWPRSRASAERRPAWRHQRGVAWRGGGKSCRHRWKNVNNMSQEKLFGEERCGWW